MLPVDYILFLQIAFFLCITPGTPRIVIVTYAINYGLKRSIITAIGDVSANTLQMIFIVFGVGTLILLYPNILIYLKWFGICYLLYIAYDIFKFSKSLNFNKNLSSKTNFSLFKDGFLVAFFSPKAWIFFPLIFPQFIDFSSNYILQFFILLITYVILDFLSLIGYAILANKLIFWFKANPKIINTISACVLVIIAMIIAITQQY